VNGETLAQWKGGHARNDNDTGDCLAASEVVALELAISDAPLVGLRPSLLARRFAVRRGIEVRCRIHPLVQDAHHLDRS
jgi:hypothetical protein